MSAAAFSFTALDTLMFRDGRPFNQGDEGASAAVSVFPPPPPTLIGALRLALAEQNGFAAGRGWPSSLLGDGVDWQSSTPQLGNLRFAAPLLTYVAANGKKEMLFPAPLHLARARRGAMEGLTLLLPRACYETDLGKVFLPAAAEGFAGVKPLEGDFLTADGMRAVLGGNVPDESHIVKRETLWCAESRVGIGRDRESRIVHDGELYTASHTRLEDDAAIVLGVDGLDKTVGFKAVTHRLGGEHRAAHITACDPAVPPAGPTSLVSQNGKYRYAAIALSPVLFNELPGPQQEVPGLEGVLSSACFGKPQKMGGWNSKARRPIAMRPVLPAGSVFFMECGDEQKALACHAGSIGQAVEWGFGQVLIARWG